MNIIDLSSDEEVIIGKDSLNIMTLLCVKGSYTPVSLVLTISYPYLLMHTQSFQHCHLYIHPTSSIWSEYFSIIQRSMVDQVAIIGYRIKIVFLCIFFHCVNVILNILQVIQRRHFSISDKNRLHSEFIDYHQ